MKPHVLQLTDSFHQGGSERQAVQVTRLLHETGRYRVHVACLNDEGVLRPEVARLGLSPIPAFPLTSFHDRNTLFQIQRFARYLRTHRIDIVQTYDFYTNVFGLVAAAIARVPVRIGARRETEGIRTTAQTRTELCAYRFAHTIIANSEAVRQQLIREGVRPGKVAKIYNGMDMERVSPQPRLARSEALARFGLPREEGRRLVTIVANMRHAGKDQPTFLRAARRVHAAFPEAAFVLAGEGELMTPLRSLAAHLGLEQATFFLGRCEAVAELLALSDVCVLSSRGIEGFSNSILEYMAAGRPVVATDVGGAREAVVEGKTGYVVPPGDDAAMAERVLSLLRDSDRARAMGEAGLDRVRREFSCRVQREHTCDLYERLLKRKRLAKQTATSALRRS